MLTLFDFDVWRGVLMDGRCGMGGVVACWVLVDVWMRWGFLFDRSSPCVNQNKSMLIFPFPSFFTTLLLCTLRLVVLAPYAKVRSVVSDPTSTLRW